MEFSFKTTNSHDGLDLYYETHGNKGVEPAIFFVHGIGGDVDAWQFIRLQLSSRSLLTVSLDLRGHGHSSHPRSEVSFEMNNFVKDIVTVLDQEHIEKCILVGHSLGAVIATSFAIEHPERLHKLVLISGTFHPPKAMNSNILRYITNRMISLVAIISPGPIYSGHSTYPEGKFHNDYEWLGLLRTILRNSLGNYLLTFRQVLNLNIKHRLREIKVPTLLVGGSKDTVAPLHILREIVTEIPHSKLEIIHGGNHVVILNNSKEVALAIDNFLYI